MPMGVDVPDPQAETTFAASRLTWSWESDPHKSGLRRLYQDLLRARHEWPALRDYSQRSARILPDTQSGGILELVRGGPPAGRRWDDTSPVQSHRSIADDSIPASCHCPMDVGVRALSWRAKGRYGQRKLVTL